MHHRDPQTPQDEDDKRYLGDFTIDFVSIRVGKMVGGLDYIALGQPETAEEQRIAQIATAKLEKGNASLPES